jgi:hypothetical protein
MAVAGLGWMTLLNLDDIAGNLRAASGGRVPAFRGTPGGRDNERSGTRSASVATSRTPDSEPRVMVGSAQCRVLVRCGEAVDVTGPHVVLLVLGGTSHGSVVAVDSDLGAVLDEPGGVAGADDRGNTELSGDDRGLTQWAAGVGDDRCRGGVRGLASDALALVSDRLAA